MGKKSGNRLSPQAMRDNIISLFEGSEGRALSTKSVFRMLGFSTYALRMQCATVLDELVDEDVLSLTPEGLFRYVKSEAFIEGTFERRSNGRNLLLPDGDDDPVQVADRDSMHALTGDRVRVALYARRKKQAREGEVIAILKRSRDTFVGRLQVQKHFAFLLAESRVLPNDIFIPKENLKGGKDGDKAVVKIVEWPDDSKNPIGKVIDILGESGNNNAEMNAILVEYGLPYSYPKSVEKAADKLVKEITPADLKGREDFRSTLTFTIDPRDAKDFDDALSIKQLSGSLWEVGVHIADVTHYVKEGGIIDKEAFKRATSIYLVDRTIPMLPESLCNNLCSLVPHEDRLTYSVIFVMNEEAEVLDSRITRTVIHSDRRFNYEEVQAVIEAGEGEQSEAILRLDALAKKLRERRFAAGAVNFERAEAAFDIDENGKPLRIYFKEAKDSNKLVEEFMLLANRTVAERIGKLPKRQEKTFVYRIHDEPDPQKLDTLAEFVARFGYKLKLGGKGTSTAINALLADVKESKEKNMIEIVSLRAMQKAVYSTCNIGHYGLAFKYYTHFTSPIRRYPDMMVHRLIDRYLSGGRSVQRNKYEENCDHCSQQEQLAMNAERASIKYKQVEFMSEHLGEEYAATISGVTEWGLYAEITENKCEGLIPIRSLGDDYYDFDERNFCLIGRRTHRRYMLGDPVTVRIAAANLEKKQLDFELAQSCGGRPASAGELPAIDDYPLPAAQAGGKKKKKKGSRSGKGGAKRFKR